VFATYSPGSPSSSDPSYAYGTSSSTPVQAFSVSSATTTTGLGLSLASVAYGYETSEIFTVTVTGQSGDGYPEGAVAVHDSSTELCSATLNPGTGDVASVTCALTASELAAGDYDDVFATYSPGSPSSSDPSYTYGTSSSTPVQAFSVGSAMTATGLGLSLTSVAYGSETSEIFTVTVTGQSRYGHPKGTVTVYNSSTELCSATLNPGTGDVASVTCALTASELAGGDYSDVFATYSPGSPSSSDPSYTYGTSSSTPVQTFSVSSVTTGLGLSLTSVAYGHETSEIFTVTVTGQSRDGHPEGTVTGYDSSTKLCSATLNPGTGDVASVTCALKASELAAGNYDDVFATYSPGRPSSSDPSYTYGTSSSAPQTFSVSKDTTRTKVSKSPTNVTYGHESASVFSVTVTTHYGEAVPNGKRLTVHVGHVTCTVVLKGGKGACTIANTALPVGSYLVSATYGGDADLSGSSGSSVSRLTVSKDTTRTKVSKSPTNVTYGHESASVFSVTVTTHYGEAVPNGKRLTVHVGHVTCTVVLKGGKGACTIANTALPVGSYLVSATYGGDADLSGSSGSSVFRLTVG
jgi:uncharacterized ParB-like nuclease family protein